MNFTIKQGMNQDILKDYPDNHFDSIVTDPPYGIEFLGKDWDSNTGAIETWQECLRVLKPGGYLLAFSAARTYHHLATNIESVGFEIRDQIMWIYGSGFPKAQDVGKNIHKRQNKERSYTIPDEDIQKLTRIEGDLYQHPDGYKVRKLPNTKGSGAADQYGGGKWRDTYERVVEVDNEWAGWKTALKPAHEPIVMARKPMRGSTVDNVLEHGVGALNIDATRIGDEVRSRSRRSDGNEQLTFGGENANSGADYEQVEYQGRFPSNVLGEIPDYQKYFYCPKVSRAERHCGFEKPPEPEKFNNPEEMKKHPLWDPSIGTNSHRLMKKIREHQGSLDHIPVYDRREEGLESAGIQGLQKIDGKKNTDGGNNHPTVKPVELMKYLIRLVTPKGGKVLDPFNGSGSTGMAAVELGYEYTGCELDPEYVAIAERRIAGWYERTKPKTNVDQLFTKKG